MISPLSRFAGTSAVCKAGTGLARLAGAQLRRDGARQHPEDRIARSSRRGGYGVRFLLPRDPRSPEEALAAFAGHGVEVEASGTVPTDATDTGHVPVELAGWVGKRCAGGHGLHVWESGENQVCIL